MLIILLIIIFITFKKYFKKNEQFNERVGSFCYTCKDKHYNACMKCFNCIWAVNADGTSGCIGGDVNNGPYNKENVKRWYVRDPYHHMKERNADYKISYGPKQNNRIY